MGWLFDIFLAIMLFMAVRNLVIDKSPLKPSLRWLFIICCLHTIFCLTSALYFSVSIGLGTISIETASRFEELLFIFLIFNSVPAIFTLKITYSYFGIEF